MDKRSTLVAAVSKKTIEQAAEHLRSGRLVGLPTETVYGLAGRGDQLTSVAKIFEAKGRPSTNPLILHVSSLESAKLILSDRLSDIQQRRLQSLSEFWPGPLTIVGPRSESVLDCVTAAQPTVAVRVPSHPVALAVLRICDFPVAAPSANRSNYVSPTRSEHVVDGLGKHLAMVLEGGPSDVGLESTIVYLGDERSSARVLRPGVLSAQAISNRLGEHVVEASSNAGEVVTVPGQSRKHYAPRTPLLVVQQFNEVPNLRPGETLLRISVNPINSTSIERVDYRFLSMAGDLYEAAGNLYDILRWADQQGYSRIEFLACEPSGPGGRHHGSPQEGECLVGNDVFHVSEMHFVKRLFSPVHGGIRVRVGRIVLAIVVPSGVANGITTSHQRRLGIFVSKLPVKIVVGHTE